MSSRLDLISTCNLEVLIIRCLALELLAFCRGRFDVNQPRFWDPLAGCPLCTQSCRSFPGAYGLSNGAGAISRLWVKKWRDLVIPTSIIKDWKHHFRINLQLVGQMEFRLQYTEKPGGKFVTTMKRLVQWEIGDLTFQDSQPNVKRWRAY